jgi:hypothetical protein
MVDLQDNLFSFERYTEDDVIYWMGVAVGTPLHYRSQFGDGGYHNVEFVKITMRNRIPVIICQNTFGQLHWGYLSQFSKDLRKKNC